MKSYWVHIVCSRSKVLYIGITNDLERRILEHQSKTIPGFTQKYQVTRLVWFEEFSDVTSAIAREKQIKAWRRSKKLALIHQTNPGLKDLFQQRDPSTSLGMTTLKGSSRP